MEGRCEELQRALEEAREAEDFAVARAAKAEESRMSIGSHNKRRHSSVVVPPQFAQQAWEGRNVVSFDMNMIKVERKSFVWNFCAIKTTPRVVIKAKKGGTDSTSGALLTLDYIRLTGWTSLADVVLDASATLFSTNTSFPMFPSVSVLTLQAAEECEGVRLDDWRHGQPLSLPHTVNANAMTSATVVFTPPEEEEEHPSAPAFSVSTSGYSSSGVESGRFLDSPSASSASPSSSPGPSHDEDSQNEQQRPLRKSMSTSDADAVAEVLFLRDRLHKLQEHARALEAMVEGLERETERLRRQALDANVSDDDEGERLKPIVRASTTVVARVRPKSVQEEVANVEVVRLGKMCGKCLGPMDGVTPAALLNEAASQIGETFKSEVRNFWSHFLFGFWICMDLAHRHTHTCGTQIYIYRFLRPSCEMDFWNTSVCARVTSSMCVREVDSVS